VGYFNGYQAALPKQLNHGTLPVGVNCKAILSGLRRCCSETLATPGRAVDCSARKAVLILGNPSALISFKPYNKTYKQCF
jgi:hypothetical protein